MYVIWKVGSLAVNYGSMAGGYNMFHTGSGFPATLDDNYYVEVTSSNSSLPSV